MYTLSLEVINQCNLDCAYCYLGEKKNIKMSKLIAYKAIELGIHEAQKQYDKTLVVYFIGGEPLMAFDIIQEAVAYVTKKCEKAGLRPIFSTTINGTLVTKAIVDFFIRNQFAVKLSLDGPAFVHDLNRKDYEGNGSFQKIMDRLQFFENYEAQTGNSLSIAQVIAKNNFKNFSESFQFLLELDINRIESGVDHYDTWSKDELEELKEQIIKAFYQYKGHIQKTKKSLYWNIFEQHLESHFVTCDFYACKAGLNNIFVTVDGNIYTCIELPEFKIGDVHFGLDIPRIREIAYIKEEVHEVCKECKCIKGCKTRGCLASNFEVYHDIYRPVEVNCMMTKVLYELVTTNFTDQQLSKMKNEYERWRAHGNK